MISWFENGSSGDIFVSPRTGKQSQVWRRDIAHPMVQSEQVKVAASPVPPLKTSTFSTCQKVSTLPVQDIMYQISCRRSSQ